MEAVMSLWLPIVVSAVIVFVASSILHMVLSYHQSDLRRLHKEDDVMAALRPFNIAPGDYAVPQAGSMAGMRDPKFIEKMTKGPVAFMTVVPSGPPAMGASLVMWFLFSLVVSLFAGYIAKHALGAAPTYLQVFRFVGTSAFMAYGVGQMPNSIWFRKNWMTTAKAMVDGLLYAALTAGTFGWLWPR
jgi:hypothetical protein